MSELSLGTGMPNLIEARSFNHFELVFIILFKLV